MSNVTLADAKRAREYLNKSQEYAKKEDYHMASLYMCEAARLTGLILEIPEVAEKFDKSDWCEENE